MPEWRDLPSKYGVNLITDECNDYHKQTVEGKALLKVIIHFHSITKRVMTNR